MNGGGDKKPSNPSKKRAKKVFKSAAPTKKKTSKGGGEDRSRPRHGGIGCSRMGEKRFTFQGGWGAFYEAVGAERTTG